MRPEVLAVRISLLKKIVFQTKNLIQDFLLFMEMSTARVPIGKKNVQVCPTFFFVSTFNANCVVRQGYKSYENTLNIQILWSTYFNVLYIHSPYPMIYINKKNPSTTKIGPSKTMIMCREKIMQTRFQDLTIEMGRMVIRASRLQWGKNESQNFNGCRILSQAIGQEKLRTVFVFALAHLEGPPQAFAGYNSKFK